jgi:hypothetical protein
LNVSSNVEVEVVIDLDNLLMLNWSDEQLKENGRTGFSHFFQFLPKTWDLGQLTPGHSGTWYLGSCTASVCGSRENIVSIRTGNRKFLYNRLGKLIASLGGVQPLEVTSQVLRRAL